MNTPLRRLVIIESPYAGAVERNLHYARRAMLDAINRGEAPIASHLIYTQVLNDLEPDQRLLGIECGFAWSRVADLHAFYEDFGWSRGMHAALNFCRTTNKPYEFRKLEK